MAIPSTTLTLTPQLNALAVIAQSAHDTLVEAERTKAIFHEQMGEKEKAVQEQAARITLLENQIRQLEAQNQRLVVAHKAEIDPLLTLNAQLQARVKYLEGDVQDRQNLLDTYSKNLHESKYVLGNLCKGHGHNDVGRRNWADAHRVANS